MRSIVGVALLVFVVASPVFGEEVFYGLLHAHTSYSDGSGTPTQAYRKAKGRTVDFFAVTPHNHARAEGFAKDRKDGLLIATNHDLYNAAEPFGIAGHSGRFKSVIRAAKDQTSDTFVALYGQEFSTISSGNHANVFGIDEVLTVGDGAYRDLYVLLAELERAGSPAAVVQLNHPNVQADFFYAGSKASERRKMFNDYGFDDLGFEFEELVRASDRYVSLIEVLSGPSATKDKKFASHSYKDHGNDYYYYLTQGFHISPSVGHDNHYKHWGDKSPARMGVVADSLTREDLYEAMRENRTFATEDSDLNVSISINGTAMGGVESVDAGDDLIIVTTVSDPSDSGESYEVTLIYGTVEPQDLDTLEKWTETDGEQEMVERDGDGTVAFEGYVSSGVPEFFYVVVEQEDGDRAWSAPVWINHPRLVGIPEFDDSPEDH